MERKAFLSRLRVGLILRTYATKEDQIPDRLRLTQEAVTRAKQLMVDDVPVIRRVDVMVWTDRRYKEADCGKTAEALRKQFENEKDVYVHEYAHGDIFCGILNHAVALQMRDRVDYSIILSPDAASYFNSETVTAMIDAACRDALAIGVAIDELTESVMAGRITNTFAMWHNVSLMSVGGFDLRAAKPIDDRTAHYLRGWHEAKGDVFYQLAGVEEDFPGGGGGGGWGGGGGARGAAAGAAPGRDGG